MPSSSRRGFYPLLAAPFALFLFATVLGVDGEPDSFPFLVVGVVLLLLLFLYMVVKEYYYNKDPGHEKRPLRG